jgi:predicted nuclease of predicted toxin-antitoxin system
VRVLLDEMLPAGVAKMLPDHEVTTVREAGWTGLDNGELLRAAAQAGFEVLVTADRSMPSQQNIATSGMAVILVRGSRVAEIETQGDALRNAVASTEKGRIIRLGRR